MIRKQIVAIVIGISIAMIPLFSQTLIITANNKLTPKKFKTTLVVVYNAITLEEAAEKEKIFREKYIDACSVDVKLEEISVMSWVSTGSFIVDTLNTSVQR